MSLEKKEQISKCLTCKHSKMVTMQNLYETTNDVRETRNKLNQHGYKDEEFTLCTLEGNEVIVSKYIDVDCSYYDDNTKTSRRLVTVQRISEIISHPNADRLEIARVLGWKCVVKKDDFKVGDFVLYFEIDSFLPIREEFAFLEQYKRLHPITNQEGYRIKTIRLRGYISQGLVMSIDTFKDIKINYIEDYDVSDLLNVIKYEKVDYTYIDSNGKPRTRKVGISPDAKGLYPAFIPKTDEVRVQSIIKIIKKYEGVQCYVTEKIDGISYTSYKYETDFGVCTRHLELKRLDKNAYWEITRKLDIESKLMNYNKNIAIQGEMYGFFGSAINGNKLKQSDVHLAIYNIYLIDELRYLSYDEMKKLTKEWELETVPLITENYNLTSSIDELVDLATRKSIINPDTYLEGIVVRPIKPIIDEYMFCVGGSNGSGNLSFKVLNPEYLIKYDE